MTGDAVQPADRRVLVTGASGFIGGRVVEKLVRERQARVRALVRDVAGAVRIARLPVELAQADVTDLDSVRNGVQGCDAIIHCAYGNRGDASERRAVNVEGTRNVLEAALESGCRRVVHLSTLMAYGMTPESVLRETAPRRRSGDAYADAKLDTEQLALAYHSRHGLGVSVIQPTAVYGPFAPAWTERVLEELTSGIVPLIDGGTGICNAVYVDDVADAVLLAAERDEAVGEAFLISGEPVSYRDFYGRFAQMVGGQRTASLSVEEALARWRAAGGEPMDATDPIHVRDPVTIRFQSLTTTVSTDKASRRLGYQPSFDFETGMRLTQQWALWANLIPGAAAGRTTEP